MTTPDDCIEPRELADWLLARGRHWVTVVEAAELLDVPPEQVAPTLARYRHRGLLFAPTRGAYVPVPPEYRSWGAVPASHFIDPMMRFLGHEYYVDRSRGSWGSTPAPAGLPSGVLRAAS